MTVDDLVSCLCITRNRVSLLRRAVSCFLGQTYEQCELDVVYESEDTATRDYLRTLCDPRIRTIEVPSSAGLTLGSLRTLSLEQARGQYVAQWDDDDWYAPTRLAEQMKSIRESGLAGCVLSRWTIHDATTQRSYISGKRTWEGSLVAERAAVPAYPPAKQGEDTPVIDAMMKKKQLTLLERPELYIYIFHGLNTWNRKHWLTLMKYAKRLGRQDEDRISRVLTISVPTSRAA